MRAGRPSVPAALAASTMSSKMQPPSSFHSAQRGFACWLGVVRRGDERGLFGSDSRLPR